jgi:hypothetical protein
VRIFKQKTFARFVKKERLSDDKLRAIVEEMESGTIHADLGGNVIKQRVAREGQGKRGGYRVIVLYKLGERVFFVHGFAKSDEDNISKAQEDKYRTLAAVYLGLTEAQIEQLVAAGEFTEVEHGAEN